MRSFYHHPIDGGWIHIAKLKQRGSLRPEQKDPSGATRASDLEPPQNEKDPKATPPPPHHRALGVVVSP